MNIIKELKRRNVIKGSLAYVVFSWLVLQIISIVFPILKIPLGYQQWVLIGLLIGFPFWIVFSYIYEWTPEGFRPTPKLESGEAGQPAVKSRSNPYIIFGLTLALALLIADKIFDLSSAIGPEEMIMNTIAVLPFSHQSTSEEDSFFTSGVHEDLMTKLAGVKEFRIMSKSSVMPYKDYQGDLSEVGKKLNADYIMQGSVRRWQDRVRMNIQLIESVTDQVIWSHEYNGQLENVFDLQADIATVITQKLKTNLTSDETRELESAPTDDVVAYDNFLKARYLLNQPRANFEDIQESIELLEQAVSADRKFVNAWSQLARAHGEAYNKLSKVGGREMEMQDQQAKARYALGRAKELAPSSWEVLSAEGILYMYVDEDSILALNAFEKALEQNPSDVDTMGKLAQLYIQMGDIKKSIDILEKAFKLTQTNGFIAYGLSFAYELNGEYEKMVPFLQRLAELYPEEKHYTVEARYYQFLHEGSLKAYQEFRHSVESTEAQNPWDERAIKNMEMTVAMFNGEFETYYQDWKGKHEPHIKMHGEWMCPLVANDFINKARLLFEHSKKTEGTALLDEVSQVVLKPIDPNSVCVFNPQVYLPKLDFLNGEQEVARDKIEELTLPVLQNRSFPLGAVERSVLLQAVDLIAPDRVYYYYEQVVKKTISMTSFESICADPWSYPNLFRDDRFIAEIRQDGRFVEFLESNGFL